MAEVGAGNGMNFEYYPDSVHEVIAVEPEPYLRGRAEQAAGRARAPVRVVDGTADALPLEASSVDAVVVAGVLCSVPDQARALAEFRRVLKPGGTLRFYEHVRSTRPRFAATRTWSRSSGAGSWAAASPTATPCPRSSAAASPSSAAGASGFRRARAYPVAPRILGEARAR